MNERRDFSVKKIDLGNSLNCDVTVSLIFKEGYEGKHIYLVESEVTVKFNRNETIYKKLVSFFGKEPEIYKYFINKNIDFIDKWTTCRRYSCNCDNGYEITLVSYLKTKIVEINNGFNIELFLSSIESSMRKNINAKYIFDITKRVYELYIKEENSESTRSIRERYEKKEAEKKEKEKLFKNIIDDVVNKHFSDASGEIVKIVEADATDTVSAEEKPEA